MHGHIQASARHSDIVWYLIITCTEYLHLFDVCSVTFFQDNFFLCIKSSFLLNNSDSCEVGYLCNKKSFLLEINNDHVLDKKEKTVLFNMKRML